MVILASRRVVLPEGRALAIRPAILELEGPRIARVRALADHEYEATIAEQPGVVDYGDRPLTPAFIDGHTHLPLVFLRGATTQTDAQGNLVEDLFFRHESKLTPEDVRAFTRMGAYESLLSGTGLVWEHYYFGEALADGLSDAGLAGVIAPTLQDLEGPGRDGWESALAQTESIASGQAPGIYAALGPHATDTVSETLWKRTVETASRLDLPVHFHLAQSLEELERCHDRHGCSPVEWLDRLGVLDEARALMVHALYCSRADLERLDANRHTLALCPLAQLIFGFPAPVDMWSELSLPWIVATDGAASNDSNDVQGELRYVAGTRTAHVPDSQPYRQFMDSGALADARSTWSARNDTFVRRTPLATATALLARVWDIPGAMHPAFTAGRIESGALANLLVWDHQHPSLWPATDLLHTLAMGNTAQAIHAMFVAGQRIGTDGDFHRSVRESDDYRQAHREATDRLAALGLA